MKKIEITQDMRKQAALEAAKRDAYIKHHFNVGHLSHQLRDEIGFLGEFACCELFNINWKENIRDNYLTIDDFDLVISNKKADIKTETVPLHHAKKILSRTINDNELYGRRLINQGQFNLLHKYDVVIFSLFIREDYTNWYPIGYLDSKTIITKFPPTFARPDGGKYPFPGSPVPTSALKPLTDLI